MAREKVGFRDELERIDRIYPERELLTVKETAKYLGVCEKSVTRHIKRTKLGVPKVEIAKFLVDLKEG